MRAAVIDVGSNSIKLLVADQGPGGRPVEVLSRTLEVRISKGIASSKPRLSPEGMDRGVGAIVDLASQARELGSQVLAAVATSAVRDAENGLEFRGKVRGAARVELRILSGTEEADLIGRGLTTDPALDAIRDFHVYDLGGGSLECLAFRDRSLERVASLPLGCVRLTEMFVQDAAGPLPGAALSAIARHVEESLRRSGFPLPVPGGSFVVGTGGTLTTVRSIAGARRAVGLERTDPLIRVSFLRELLASLAVLDLAGRRAVRGLSAERADVFPAALAALIGLAELGEIQAFHHSLRNLRWGVAAELLAPPAGQAR